MKNILVIGAMSAASAAAIVAELSNRENEQVIVVIAESGPDYDHVREFTPILPVLYAGDYVAIETGEVVPDFVPAKVKIPTSPFKGEVFHPPKVTSHPFDKSTSLRC